MQPTRRFSCAFRFHCFRYGSCERDHVMTYFALDLLNTRDIERGVGTEGRGGFSRHFTDFGERFGSGELYLKPAFVFVLVAPNSAHLRACVARNHSRLFWRTTPAKGRGCGWNSLRRP